eukprot:m.75722 g.75722  ORF g.75722 m.75722 type:complete len:546 (+) comp12457_c1_seq1:282-1919(+)
MLKHNQLWTLMITIFVLNTVLSVSAMQSEHNKGEVESTSVYGGILNQFSQSVKASDDDVASATFHAVKFLLQQQKHMCLSSIDVKQGLYPVTIQFVSKHVLQYTRDGHTKAFISYRDQQFRIQRRAVILGVTYYMTMQFQGADPKLASIWHHFAVTMDRSKVFSVLSHYTTVNASPQETTRSSHAIYRSGTWYLLDEPAKQLSASLATLVGKGFVPQQGQVVALQPHTCWIGGSQVYTSVKYFASMQRQAILWTETAINHKQTATSEPRITVVSYNIWNLNQFEEGKYNQRIAKLAEQVRAESPDLIAFQEVRHDAQRGCQLETLAALLPGYEFTFQAAMSYPENTWHRVEEGIAVFTRLPVYSVDYIQLSRDVTNPNDAHQRIMFRTTVDIPSFGPFSVVSSHFALDERARHRGCVEAANFLFNKPWPFAFLGDLNAEPDTPGMRFLIGQHELSGQTVTGMYDLWLQHHAEPRPGNKYSSKEEKRDPGLTFNTFGDNLVKRIDYALIRQHPAVTTPWIRTIPEHLDRNPASDHTGLVFEIMFHP